MLAEELGADAGNAGLYPPDDTQAKPDVRPTLRDNSSSKRPTPTVDEAQRSARKVMNWSEANRMWTKLNAEIAAVKEDFPSVQALAATNNLGKFLEASDGDALNAVTLSLNKVLDAVVETRANLNGSIKWYGLKTAVHQVLAGNSGPTPKVDWHKPVAAFAAKSAQEDGAAVKWWEVVGIGAGVAAMIVGGPVGFLLGAAELAIGAASSVNDLIDTKGLKSAALATAKPSLALIEVRDAETRTAGALFSFALSVAAVIGALKVAKGYRAAIKRKITRASKFKVGSPEWNLAKTQLGVSTEILKEYVYMLRHWDQIRVHHLVMQTLENSKLIALGIEKKVFNIHQLTNLRPLPFNSKVQRAIRRVIGTSRAIHDSNHIRTTARVTTIVERKWRILAKHAGDRTVRQFVQTNEGRQVLHDLCEESRIAAQALVNRAGTRLP